MPYNKDYYKGRIKDILNKNVRGQQATYENINDLLKNNNYKRFGFYILHLEKGRNYGTRDREINNKINLLTHLPSTNRTDLGDGFRLDIQNPTPNSNNYQIQKGDNTLATILVNHDLMYDIDMEVVKFAFRISANHQCNANILYRLSQLVMDDFKNLKHNINEEFKYLFDDIRFT